MSQEFLSRVIDLFAGGGGLTLGFANAGFKIVAAFDNWQPAINFYEANFPNHPILKGDLAKDDVLEKIFQFEPNMIIGGPPCQDFSSAGKRDESLGRANLTVAFANIVKKLKPDFFVMENVARAIKSNAFWRAQTIFKESNYGLTIKILDASLCGVPQARKRLFVIGECGGNDKFLDSALEANLSRKPMTLRNYFGERLGTDYYYRHPRSYKRRGIFSVDEPSPTIRGVNRPIPSGYAGHPGDAAPIALSVRPLTTKERSMIQTFPESLKLIGNKTEVEQIIGNAVPIKLGEYVAQRLKDYMITNHYIGDSGRIKKPIELSAV